MTFGLHPRMWAGFRKNQLCDQRRQWIPLQHSCLANPMDGGAWSVVSNPVRPHRRQPTRLPHPWDSPGKNTGVGCHFLLQCMKVKSLSRVQLLVTPWTAAYQIPPSMGFSRQEYWSGVPLPSPSHTLDDPKTASIEGGPDHGKLQKRVRLKF